MQLHIKTRRDSARPGVTRMVMCIQTS